MNRIQMCGFLPSQAISGKIQNEKLQNNLYINSKVSTTKPVKSTHRPQSLPDIILFHPFYLKFTFSNQFCLLYGPSKHKRMFPRVIFHSNYRQLRGGKFLK